MKRCSRCQVTKPLDAFYRSSQSPDGRQGHCKACNRDGLRERAARRPRKLRKRVEAPPGFKHCPGCKQIKPLEAFCNNRSSGDGKAFYCKECHNARGSESRQRLYGGTRHYHLMRRYGVGDAEVAAMIEAQGGVCLICKGPLDRPHVDHDHVTGKVRGVLCFNCNAGLGKFRDNVEIVERALAYLRGHDSEAEKTARIAHARLEALDLAGPIRAAQIKRLADLVS